MKVQLSQNQIVNKEKSEKNPNAICRSVKTRNISWFFNCCKVFKLGTSQILRLNFLLTALLYENCKLLAVSRCFQIFFFIFFYPMCSAKILCLWRTCRFPSGMLEMLLQYHFTRGAVLGMLEKMKSRHIRNIGRDICLSSILLKKQLNIRIAFKLNLSGQYVYFGSENCERFKGVLMKCLPLLKQIYFE